MSAAFRDHSENRTGAAAEMPHRFIQVVAADVGNYDTHACHGTVPSQEHLPALNCGLETGPIPRDPGARAAQSANLTRMGKVNIRFARNEDARGILEAHYSAVHQTAYKDYSPEICNDWSAPVTKERISQYLNNSFPYETTIVAEVDGEVAGFGAIVETVNELRAVYVAARFGRRGIGSTLLSELERTAKTRGCTELHLDSSVTAHAFYLSHNYLVLEHTGHALRSGRVMACVKMRKSLQQ